MRQFFSYGPVDTNLHYYAPREELLDRTYTRLVGEGSAEAGHYITVWAPRQCGKTWIMQQTAEKIKETEKFDFAFFSMEPVKGQTSSAVVLKTFCKELSRKLGKKLPLIDTWEELPGLFAKKYLDKPLILILDEFDCLEEEFINQFAALFRSIYIDRINEPDKKSGEKSFLLHGLALVGVRRVLGIENVKGSPFNVQRSIHIPNLTYEEVTGMFQWYEKESGQDIENEVVDELFEEIQGQPGLTCWFGELLTETYNQKKDEPITMTNFEEVSAAAAHVLPNNNILNIISKVKQSPYREWVLELFKTDEKINFKFDDINISYLYMNGVIEKEKVGRTDYYVKFSSPFVQKRLFNYFSGELFDYMGQLVEPFEKLDDVFAEAGLNLRNLLKCYSRYLARNRDWLLKDAPRRKDLRLYEAVYHFNLYMYLFEFFKGRGGKVYPEFPTGNGKIDLIVHYKGRVYGMELKSFTHEAAYKDALHQAARYGKELGLDRIALVFFVESIDDANRRTYETDYTDAAVGVTVNPIFIEVGK